MMDAECRAQREHFRLMLLAKSAWCLKHERTKERKRQGLSLHIFQVREFANSIQIGGKVNMTMRAIPIPAQQGIYRGSTENTPSDRTSGGESEPFIIVTAAYVAEMLHQIRNAPEHRR